MMAKQVLPLVRHNLQILAPEAQRSTYSMNNGAESGMRSRHEFLNYVERREDNISTYLDVGSNLKSLRLLGIVREREATL